MGELYTGVAVCQVGKQIINELYKEKKVKIWDDDLSWYQNMFIVVKDETDGNQSALAVVEGDYLCLLDNNISASGIKPRNKEQTMALDALLNEDIRVVALTGIAGGGKTLLSLAAALQMYEDGKYKKIIITKDMFQVGRGHIGFLKGDLDEKFIPHNQGTLCNIEFLVGGDKLKVQEMVDQYKIEFMPLALIRGSSFSDCIVICEESQNMNHHEMLTLGTRLSEGSKLIMTGDLNQIDVSTHKFETAGLYKFINDERTKESEIVSSINLIKSERGEVATLFAKVFEPVPDLF